MGKLSLFFAIVLLAPVLGAADDFRQRWHEQDKHILTTSDIAAEVEFGRRVAAYLLGKEQLLDNGKLTRYINLVGKSLALHSARNELEYRFGILQSDSVNAYSTPGGYVFITTGALRLVKDEDEVAAILAHEIAHINARHIVKELHIQGTDNNNLGIFARLVSAPADTARITLTQAIDGALTMLFKTGYAVNDELEADQIALVILAAADYDPLALPRYLRRAEQYAANNRQTTVNTTHPTSKTRFAKIQTVIDEEHFSRNRPQSREALLSARFSKYFPIPIK